MTTMTTTTTTLPPKTRTRQRSRSASASLSASWRQPGRPCTFTQLGVWPDRATVADVIAAGFKLVDLRLVLLRELNATPDSAMRRR